MSWPPHLPGWCVVSVERRDLVNCLEGAGASLRCLLNSTAGVCGSGAPEAAVSGCALSQRLCACCPALVQPALGPGCLGGAGTSGSPSPSGDDRGSLVLLGFLGSTLHGDGLASLGPLLSSA